jgi:glycosyltransferase involved in cell wall biosynthesis
VKIAQVSAVDFTMAHFLLPLALAEREAGHEVIAVCSDGPWVGRVRAAGIAARAVPIPRGLNPRALWRAYRALAALFRAERFDMVHVHTPVAAAIGRIAAWRAGVPRIVYTAHGFSFHDRMPGWRRLPHVLAEWLLGRITHVLLTQAAEDAAFARRWRLVPRGRPIAAIGNGVDPARFAGSFDRDATRASLDTPVDAVVLVTIGRLVAEKGHGPLIEAMKGTGAHLWIVGERLASDHAGEVGALLEGARRDPALGSRLRLLGRREDVPAILAAADIFVLASFREGMPRSVIEAMAAGLPVIGTNVRGTREEVVEGETGLLVEPGDAKALADAIERLAGDPVLRRRLGVAGRDRARALYDERVVIRRQLDLLGLTPRP